MGHPLAGRRLVGGFALLSLLLAVVWDGRGAAAAEPETNPERVRELRAVLPPEQREVDEQELAGVSQMLEALFGPKGPRSLIPTSAWLVKLSLGPRTQMVVTHFDSERLVDSLKIAKDNGLGLTKPDILKTLGPSFCRGIVNSPVFTQGKSYRVKRLEIDVAKQEGAVIVSHRLDNDAVATIRYMLNKRNGKWRFWDLEDSDTSMKASSTIAAMMTLTPEELFKALPAMKAVNAATQALGAMDFDEAKRQLESTADVTMPDDFEALRWLLFAAVRANDFDNEGSLECANKAEALRPDMTVVWLRRANTYCQMGKYRLAREQAEKYLARMGDHSECLATLGVAFNGLGQNTAALDVHRRGLASDADSSANLLGLARNLTAKELKEFDESLGRVSNLASQFETLAQGLIDEDLHAPLKMLTDRRRKIEPADWHTDQFEAESLRRQQKHELAARVLREAIQRFPRQAELADAYRACMHGQGKIIDAYQEAADARKEFRHLGEQLNSTYGHNRGRLGKLVEAHRQRFPDDKWLPLFAALDKHRKQDWPGAAELFAQAVKSLSDAEFAPYRDDYRRTMVNAKRGVELYEMVTWKDELLDDLANQFRWKGDDASLGKLIDLHEKHHPGDPRLLVHRARLLMIQGKATEAAELLRPHLAEKTEHFEQETFLDAMIACSKSVEAYQVSPLRDQAFGYLAMRVWGEELEKLLQAAQVREVANPLLPYYQARALVAKDQPTEAILLMKRTMETTPQANWSEDLHDLFLHTAVSQPDALFAYENSPLPREAFRTLATWTHEEDNAEMLARLVAAHQKRVPDDRAIALQYLAAVDQVNKRFDEAARKYAQACELADDIDMRNECLASRIECYYAAGKVLEGYREIQPQATAFDNLATHCSNDGKVDLLAALVEARRADCDPEDLVSWEAEILWLKKDYEGLVKLLSGRPSTAAWLNTAEQHLVRSLVHLKRYDEAAQVADRVDDDIPFYLAIVAASRGDAAAAISAMEECLKFSHYSVDDLGADEILGPILHTPAYEEFWKKQKALEEAENAE